MKAGTALWFGVALAVAGIAWLWFAANARGISQRLRFTCFLPPSRKTSLCTIVGAVSGAIPPVIGWTAAHP
jgi:protoheme IX farnesyltransferase